EKRAAQLEKQNERLIETLTTLRRHDLPGLRERVASLDAGVHRELRFAERVVRRMTDRHQEWRAEKALDRMARIAAGQQPILVGPWTGEVGFELIYWAPFVRWFA